MAKRKGYLPRVEVQFRYCPECYRHGHASERHTSMALAYQVETYLCDICGHPMMYTTVGIETMKPDVLLDYLTVMDCLLPKPKAGGTA